MRWLLLLVTGLALLLSSCGKPGSGERIAVVNWDKALEGHTRYALLQRQKEEYNLLLDKRREQEIAGKTQMNSLAKLQQLKLRSRQSFLSAGFMTRMAERQAAEQEQLKKLSSRYADEVDKELAAEEKKLDEHYRLRIFNLRIKLDTVRMMPEEREKLNAELKAVQAARERDRMLLMQHKIGLVNQRMQPHVNAMRQRLDAYARQLQAQMMDSLKKNAEQDASALQKAPGSLKDLLGSVDEELDKRQQGIESLETSIKKDMESVVAKLAKERGYTVVFHKYRTNVSADDITGDVIAGLKKLEIREQAVDALSKKTSAPVADQKQDDKKIQEGRSNK
ncbi:MAG: OmpH family outer membrane protein [Acidaminococcaceae bacterium]|nr:OmpH family outer membrane protein [Acidaminococcaceae bacterium]